MRLAFFFCFSVSCLFAFECVFLEDVATVFLLTTTHTVSHTLQHNTHAHTHTQYNNNARGLFFWSIVCVCVCVCVGCVDLSFGVG